MILKSGFYDKNMNLQKNQTKDNIDDPKNKIILIYNSGQDYHDIPRSNLKDCANTIDISALATLVNTKINNKEIMLYIIIKPSFNNNLLCNFSKVYFMML